MIYQDFCQFDESLFKEKCHPDVLQLIQLHLFTEALNFLQTISKKTKKENYFLAVCCQKLKKYEQALCEYQALSKTDQNNIYYALGQADCYFHLGQPKKSLQIYKTIFGKLNEDHPKYQYILSGAADIYFFIQDFSKAEILYAKCLEINSKCSKSLSQLGFIALKNKDIEKSLAYLRRSIQLDSKNYVSWVHLSLVYHYMGDISLCLGVLDHVLQNSLDHIKALKLWAAIHIQLGNCHKVISKISNYNNKTHFNWCQYTLAKCYFLLGKVEQAKKHLDKVSLKSEILGLEDLDRCIKLSLS